MERHHSPSAGSASGGDDKLEFVDLPNNEFFTQTICMPYFQDIYKDLVQRSDDTNKGINLISLLDYVNLPGILGERLFSVLDKDKNNYLD